MVPVSHASATYGCAAHAATRGAQMASVLDEMLAKAEAELRAAAGPPPTTVFATAVV